MYAAVVAGLMAALNQAESNMSGALIMGVSRALYEEVTFDKGRVTSLDWVTYPLLRFKDHPKVTTVRGAAVRPPVDRQRASRRRRRSRRRSRTRSSTRRVSGIYEAPMTPARVRATLQAAGVHRVAR